jgi:hypothetical protein
MTCVSACGIFSTKEYVHPGSQTTTTTTTYALALVVRRLVVEALLPVDLRVERFFTASRVLSI